MILPLFFALSACSTPEAPKPAPAPADQPAPMPMNMPMPAGSPAMPMNMPMPAGSPPMPMDMPMPGAPGTAAPGEEAGEGADLPPTVIPDSYAGIVTAMKGDRDTIKGLIDGGKLKEVHPIAKQLMDLASALPGKAAALSPANKGAVTLKCLDIKEKADVMHDAADEGKAAEAKAAFAAVSADVDAISGMSK